MRTITTLFTAAALTISVGCSSSAEKKSTNIAFSVSTLQNGFHQNQGYWAKRYAQEKYGVEVTVFDGKSDNATMLQIMDGIIAGDFAAASLQIWPQDDAAAKWQQMIDKGIAVESFFDQPKVQIPLVNADEASISEKMGQIAARQWKAAHPDKPIVIAEIGWPEHPGVKAGRTDPFVRGVKSVDPTAIDLGCKDGSKGAEAAKAAVQAMVAEHPDLCIIYSEAADLTLGTMPGLKEVGRGTMVNGVPTTEIVLSVDCPENELYDVYNPSLSLKMSLALPPREIAQKRIDVLTNIQSGAIKQVDPANASAILVPATLVGYWESMTADQAVAWYNEEFQAHAQMPAY